MNTFSSVYLGRPSLEVLSGAWETFQEGCFEDVSGAPEEHLGTWRVRAPGELGAPGHSGSEDTLVTLDREGEISS